MGGFFSPQTASREPSDVPEFRTNTLTPFFENLFRQPGGPGNPFAVQAGAQQRELQNQLGGIRSNLSQLLQGGGLGAGQQVIEAAQPIFQDNLAAALRQNQGQVSSPFNTAFGLQNLDTTTRALRDFNLFQQQALQQGQETALGAAGQLGNLAFGQQDVFTSQFINPTLRLLLGGAQLGQPLPGAVRPSLFSDILGATATVAGGSGLFGGGGNA